MVDASVPDIALEPDKTVRKVQVEQKRLIFSSFINNKNFESCSTFVYD